MYNCVVRKTHFVIFLRLFAKFWGVVLSHNYNDVAAERGAFQLLHQCRGAVSHCHLPANTKQRSLTLPDTTNNSHSNKHNNQTNTILSSLKQKIINRIYVNKQLSNTKKVQSDNF